MIKNAVLYYGMPLTGKTTILVRDYRKDFAKYHTPDLCLTLWTFLHHNRRARTATFDRMSSRNGSVPAVRLPYNPNKWLGAIGAFHARYPHIHQALIDECQCVSPVYLCTIVMIIRDFYPNLPVKMASIDYDSWHHKIPGIQKIIQLVPKSYHLHHMCMLCNKRVATRRLHVVNHRPVYNRKKYDHILRYHLYTVSGHPNMYSVCSRHYRHLPNDFEKILKRQMHHPQHAKISDH